ncbi:NADP-dependent phosphogluconate dehydrogenase [Youngiibacter fragilis]|uniref:6-phosphogluconate dehydrogenase, decarboxylating n=1 Tax=Youngiibacter fragilis 232.1 TaxID=994573 RepID=V7I6G4_9CLOT|nr:NADP-dependent phosphogluconate dehydrogenase [Youngiibacter fragilis]ETA80794.1 6-phosphogluconate dehydrogenase [Youngiibacter fragilis 232.1]
MKDIGILGLGVMGRNLALNIAHRGFGVSVYNYTPNETEEFVAKHMQGEDISAFYDVESFVRSLKSPRKIFLMIMAGKPVDNMIEVLIPLLDRGDLIIDGGNTYYFDTDRRMRYLEDKGLLYLGVGVSGGESGALNGPSLMPGGSREAYALVEDILTAMSARTEAGPCCTYVGNGSAGHFVKMLHNGIEYGMMQSMSEVYDIMRNVLKLSADEIGDVFEKWNEGDLNSYLMEISYRIMRKKDDETGKPLVDLILDKAGQKGTGKWTAEASLDLGVPAPSLYVAVYGRVMSFFKDERQRLSELVKKEPSDSVISRDALISDLENSLLFSNFVMYSQGIWLMNEASRVYGFEIDTAEVLKIWKGGCIIRARMLDLLIDIVREDRDNFNLLGSEKALSFLRDRLPSMRRVTMAARDHYVPTLVHNTALDYIFSMIEADLPANLTQAQRDFFGAHTYSRIDKEGIFHTKWE